MHVALHMTFAASRKEPLGEVVERRYRAIPAAGFGEPFLQFLMADAPVAGGVSSVDRVLRRLPDLARFAHQMPMGPGGPERRAISNTDGSPSAGETLDFTTIIEIARGVPRSFPFHNLSLQFRFAALPGGVTALAPLPLGLVPGIFVNDS